MEDNFNEVNSQWGPTYCLVFSPKLEQALPHNQCLYCIVRKNYFNIIYSLGIF